MNTLRILNITNLGAFGGDGNGGGLYFNGRLNLADLQRRGPR